MALLKKKSDDSGETTQSQQTQNQDIAKMQERQVTERMYAFKPVINQKIDDYIKANPKYMEFLNGLDKERLIRMVVHDEVRAEEAKQNLARGFHQLAVSNPALAEVIAEIRRTQPPEKQEQEIARLGKAFAISTDKRVTPIRASQAEDTQTQSGPRMSV
jgi:hypothetical protein